MNSKASSERGTRQNAAQVQLWFPGRFKMNDGDSKDTLPTFTQRVRAGAEPPCDVILVDGSHQELADMVPGKKRCRLRIMPPSGRDTKRAGAHEPDVDMLTVFLRKQWEGDRALDVAKFTLVPSYRCGRCGVPTTTPSSCDGQVRDPMGGNFDGVVCPYHKICDDCWWQPGGSSESTCSSTAYLKGARASEKPGTAHTPLVNGPFKKLLPKCPGCRQGMEMHVLRAQELFAKHERNKASRLDVIDLDADDVATDDAVTDTEDATAMTTLVVPLTADETTLHLTLNYGQRQIKAPLSASTRFHALYVAFAEFMQATTSDVRMTFDGDELKPLSSPLDYDMEDGDVVDVYLSSA